MHMSFELEVEAERPAMIQDGVSDEEIEVAKAAANSIFGDVRLVEIGLEQLLHAADTNKDGCLQQREWEAWIKDEKAVRAFQDAAGKLAADAFENDAFHKHESLRRILRACFHGFL